MRLCLLEGNLGIPNPKVVVDAQCVGPHLLKILTNEGELMTYKYVQDSIFELTQVVHCCEFSFRMMCSNDSSTALVDTEAKRLQFVNCHDTELRAQGTFQSSIVTIGWVSPSLLYVLCADWTLHPLCVHWGSAIYPVQRWDPVPVWSSLDPFAFAGRTADTLDMIIHATHSSACFVAAGADQLFVRLIRTSSYTLCDSCTIPMAPCTGTLTTSVRDLYCIVSVESGSYHLVCARNGTLQQSGTLSGTLPSSGKLCNNPPPMWSISQGLHSDFLCLREAGVEQSYFYLMNPISGTVRRLPCRKMTLLKVCSADSQSAVYAVDRGGRVEILSSPDAPTLSWSLEDAVSSLIGFVPAVDVGNLYKKMTHRIKFSTLITQTVGERSLQYFGRRAQSTPSVESEKTSFHSEMVMANLTSPPSTSASVDACREQPCARVVSARILDSTKEDASVSSGTHLTAAVCVVTEEELRGMASKFDHGSTEVNWERLHGELEHQRREEERAFFLEKEKLERERYHKQEQRDLQCKEEKARYTIREEEAGAAGSFLWRTETFRLGCMDVGGLFVFLSSTLPSECHPGLITYKRQEEGEETRQPFDGSAGDACDANAQENASRPAINNIHASEASSDVPMEAPSAPSTPSTASLGRDATGEVGPQPATRGSPCHPSWERPAEDTWRRDISHRMVEAFLQEGDGWTDDAEVSEFLRAHDATLRRDAMVLLQALRVQLDSAGAYETVVELFENQTRATPWSNKWVPCCTTSSKPKARKDPPAYSDWDGAECTFATRSLLPSMYWCWISEWESDSWVYATQWTSQTWSSDTKNATALVRRRRWYRTMHSASAWRAAEQARKKCIMQLEERLKQQDVDILSKWR